MNKKEIVGEYIQTHRYFSLDQIVKSIGLEKQVAINYIQLLKDKKTVFSAGRGLYTSVSKEFTCPENNRIAKLRQLIKKEFPGLDFIIWNTLYFQPYYHHQQTHHITFIDVEYDAVHPVADRISRFYRYVFTETKGKDLPLGFDITKNPIIVRRLISRSPRDGHEPRLEKMLVDIYVIKDKYKIMPEADYWELWRGIYSLYRINFSAVIDYALKRRNLRALISQLIDNIDIKDVINVSKSMLLTRITQKKSGS